MNNEMRKAAIQKAIGNEKPSKYMHSPSLKSRQFGPGPGVNVGKSTLLQGPLAGKAPLT